MKLKPSNNKRCEESHIVNILFSINVQNNTRVFISCRICVNISRVPIPAGDRQQLSRSPENRIKSKYYNIKIVVSHHLVNTGI